LFRAAAAAAVVGIKRLMEVGSLLMNLFPPQILALIQALNLAPTPNLPQALAPNLALAPKSAPNLVPYLAQCLILPILLVTVVCLGLIQLLAALALTQVRIHLRMHLIQSFTPVLHAAVAIQESTCSKMLLMLVS